MLNTLGRADFAAQLRTLLPGYSIVEYATTPDAVAKRTQFTATELELAKDAGPFAYTVTYEMVVMTALENPVTAEKELDAALGDVIVALWEIPNLVLTNAKRTQSEDGTIQSWTLTIHTLITITKE